MNKEQALYFTQLVDSDMILKEELENTETIEDIVTILNKKGFNISMNEIMEGLQNYYAGEGEEIDIEVLSQVAGGYCEKGRNWKCFWSYLKGYFSGIYDVLRG